MEALQKQLNIAEECATAASRSFDSTKAELDRVLPFEKEVKEKNLLIGKLRHEAVILNDHLTKALRYLKKGKPEDTIDKFVHRFPSFFSKAHYCRQLVTNHFMHFLALDRADPKKFQVLQIIANLLGWTEGDINYRIV